MSALKRGDGTGVREERTSGASAAAAAQRARRRRGQILRSKLDRKLSPYLFISPFFLLFAVFGFFPMVFTFWVSLHDWSLVGGNAGFIGLENYEFLIADDKFWNALVNTLAIFLIAIVPQLLLALLLADTLNRRIRFRGFWRVATILPYITSIAAMAIVFSQLFGRDYGLINLGLDFLGIGAIDWHSNRVGAWVAIAIMIDWRWLGFNTLIYLAAMQAIPKDLYESAAIDGASRMRQFWQITIPMVRPTLVFTVIISTIGQMQLFTEPVIFSQDYRGGNQGQYQTVAMLMFDEARRLDNFGYGAAIAWVIFLLIIFFAVVNVLFISRIRSAN